jgi:hypothetical protein
MKGPGFGFGARIFRQQTVGLSQQTPVRSFFLVLQDIFPRLRFGKDVHTPGTPAFDSVSPSPGLFRELIPAISFFIRSAFALVF